jgi:hypothetical protein
VPRPGPVQRLAFPGTPGTLTFGHFRTPLEPNFNTRFPSKSWHIPQIPSPIPQIPWPIPRIPSPI